MRRKILAALAAILLLGAGPPELIIGGDVYSPPPSGGGSPTWTGTGAAAQGTCSFVTTCTITTTAAVTGGVVVVMVGVNNQQSTAGTISAIHVCGTALTVDVANSIAAGAYGGAMGHGTVTGGTCTITVTFSVSGAIQNAGVAWGTLNNLNSSTPGTACNAFYNESQNSPFPCTGGLTVSSGGFGIVGYFDNQTTTPGSSGAVTVDATAANSGGTSTEVAIGHTTATCDGNANPGDSSTCRMTGANFAQVTVLGEPFR